MPYIDQARREMYNGAIRELYFNLEHSTAQDAAGDFTYIIFVLLKRFSGKFWMRALGMGCLVMAAMETYRTDHAIYEQEKKGINGGVS